jgi:uncharacterized membrane protein (DUF485 family)
MADEHENPQAAEDEGLRARNARYGAILFVLYLLFYGGFIALNLANPSEMAVPVLAGVNLAIVFGFFLIGMAFVLALIYVRLCNKPLGSGAGASQKTGASS